jgi:hypothetical protein
MVFVYRQGVPMNQLNPARAALLALDFPNYGVHPQDYWATHGEPDWPAIARPAERFIRDLEGNQMGR